MSDSPALLSQDDIDAGNAMIEAAKARMASIRQLQDALNDLGASPSLTLDGQLGPNTRAAAKKLLGI